jgi:hypothetical protein
MATGSSYVMDQSKSFYNIMVKKPYVKITQKKLKYIQNY